MNSRTDGFSQSSAHFYGFFARNGSGSFSMEIVTTDGVETRAAPREAATVSADADQNRRRERLCLLVSWHFNQQLALKNP
jgi:hypothetical protein